MKLPMINSLEKEKSFSNPMDDDHSPSTQSEAPLPKRRKLSTHDRFSELPDLALTHILSHLFIHEAARTSILSKRFSSLWNSIPILKFSDEKLSKSGEGFVAFVNSALSRHLCREIDEFSLTFRYVLTHKNSIDEWISFALQKKVKRLHLNFFQKPIITISSFGSFVANGAAAKLKYDLPECVYNDCNLVEFVIYRCKFSQYASINWNSMRKLSISRTKLDEKLISRVLCGCPVLETLELKEWCGFNKLKINSDSLKVLRIIDELCPRYMIHPEEDCLFEVSGPNLVSLEVSGLLYRTKLRVSDVGFLSNATMNFEIKAELGGSKVSWRARFQDIVREVLECLCFVKTLTVGGWCMKALSSCEAFNLSSPWSERQHLILCIPLIKWIHLGITSLLQSSPYLETLTIRLSHCSDMCFLEHGSENGCNNECFLVHGSEISCNQSNNEYYWKSWSTISKCPLLHLKKVKVIGFRDTCRSMKPLFQFLEFLLRNSSVLEEIAIQASNFVTQGLINEALKLLDVPTASPDAVVLFEPPHLWVDRSRILFIDYHVDIAKNLCC